FRKCVDRLLQAHNVRMLLRITLEQSIALPLQRNPLLSNPAHGVLAHATTRDDGIHLSLRANNVRVLRPVSRPVLEIQLAQFRQTLVGTINWLATLRKHRRVWAER